jgi:hypothetical protein
MSVSVALISASFVCACSVLYGNYDDRFSKPDTSVQPTDASTAFFTASAAITHLAVASGNVFVATGGEIVQVPEDGGPASDWWFGDSGTDQVVALASNGSDTLIWSFGSQKNSVFVSSTDSSSAATDVDDGSAYGASVAAGADVAWSTGNATQGCTSCPVAKVRSNSGVQTILTFDASEPGRPPDAGKTAIGAKAISIDEAGVDVVISSPHFLRFDLSGNVLCSSQFAASLDGVVAAPSGSPTFLLSGQAEGVLSRYASMCPALDAGGVTLSSDVSLSALISDESAVYWSSNEGDIFRADLTDDVSDSGVRLGSVTAAPTSLAVGSSWIYAAIGAQLFRFPK